MIERRIQNTTLNPYNRWTPLRCELCGRTGGLVPEDLPNDVGRTYAMWICNACCGVYPEEVRAHAGNPP